jgi:hypothetical protein
MMAAGRTGEVCMYVCLYVCVCIMIWDCGGGYDGGGKDGGGVCVCVFVCV